MFEGAFKAINEVSASTRKVMSIAILDKGEIWSEVYDSLNLKDEPTAEPFEKEIPAGDLIDAMLPDTDATYKNISVHFAAKKLPPASTKPTAVYANRAKLMADNKMQAAIKDHVTAGGVVTLVSDCTSQLYNEAISDKSDWDDEIYVEDYAAWEAKVKEIWPEAKISKDEKESIPGDEVIIAVTDPNEGDEGVVAAFHTKEGDKSRFVRNRKKA